MDKRFDYHTLQLLTVGKVWLQYDDAPPIELHGNTCWTTRPGQHAKFHPLREGTWWHHQHAAFTGRLASRWQHAGLLPSTQTLSAPVARRAKRDLLEVCDLVPRAGKWPRLRAINALERVLLLLAEARQQTNDATPAWLVGVLDRLADGGSPSVDLEAEAHAAGVSVTTLRRLIRNTVGVAAHQYRLQHKLATARRLLIESDVPVKQVADQLGYRDVYYFSRQFSQHVGVPPGAFRRARQDAR